MEGRIPIFLRKGVEGRCAFCGEPTDFYLMTNCTILCNICPECVRMLVESGMPFVCTRCLREIKG